MSGVLASVDLRTQLAGHNRMELLLFRLDSSQRYGINVFKVQEVIQCPPLTAVAHSHPVVRGIANMRGNTISVMDLSMAIGGSPVEDLTKSYVIIAEYNRTTQGFLVSMMDRIVNMNWEQILPPPAGSGDSHYLTAVTQLDNEIVEIIDVEKVMAEVMPQEQEVSEVMLEQAKVQEEEAKAIESEYKPHILVADDSSVARNQISRTLDQVGLECTVAKNGAEALALLREMAEKGPIEDQITMVISDIEMPEMDGYTLTTEIRRDPELKGLYILLHTSLSGVFNNAMVDKVGADHFIPKFKPDELAKAVLTRVNQANAQRTGASQVEA